jgi:hypothetical protein
MQRQRSFRNIENIKSTYCLHGLGFKTGYLNQIIDDAYIVNTEDLIISLTKLRSK